MIDGFAEFVVLQLQDQRAALISDLGAGRASSFEEYKSMVGRIEGLSQAIITIKESTQRYADDS